MQSTTIVHGVPFSQKPRNGQQRVFDKAIEADLRELNIKLPTGYGKTFTAAGVYAIRQKHFGLNRLLFITPTIAQHEAFYRDGHCDLALAGVVGPDLIIDLGFIDKVDALKRHRANSAQVFAVTVQGLCSGAGASVNDLLQSGRWMVVVDEYHHYGIDKAWGLGVRELNHEFLLAMSATPHRPDEDSAFGVPAIEVLYREAMSEGAVKKLCGHAYVYKIDAIDANGEIKSMTTNDLANAIGSTNPTPEQVEKFRIERKMRWSPKYVSPLVSHPIERMLERVRTTTASNYRGNVLSHAGVCPTN
jgi:superfamily II DNA or RNA helicase